MKQAQDRRSEDLVILAGQVIDGTGADPLRNASITIRNGVVVGIGTDNVNTRGVAVCDLREHTVLPGLINMHAHLMLPGDGTPFAESMSLPDELLLLRAHANSLVALRSGVTSIRDCGGKGTIMFRLREAIRAGLVPGPRLILSGRPLTITGGHCHYFGGETDGPDGDAAGGPRPA